MSKDIRVVGYISDYLATLLKSEMNRTGKSASEVLRDALDMYLHRHID